MATGSTTPRRETVNAYRQAIRRRMLIVAALGLLCVLAFALDISTGPSALPLRDVWSGLFAPDRLTAPQVTIIRDVRLPYALMAILVGAALSLAGAEMQTVLNNPLASPFTLGVSSAASFRSEEHTSELQSRENLVCRLL